MTRLLDEMDRVPFDPGRPLLPPWGSATEAVRVAKRLKPQYVVPIHDWHLTQAGKQWLYGLVVRGLGEEGICLVPLDDFESVTVEID